MPGLRKSVSGAIAPPELTQTPPTEPNTLALIITRPEDHAECPLWIGLYRRGSASVQHIFSIESIAAVFSLLTEQGLKENQALMLSDNSGTELRQFYLLPEQLCHQDSPEAQALIIKTLEALRPNKVGLYFGLDSINPDQSQKLLEEILTCIVATNIQELYLFTGKLGVNSVVNAALRVKQRLSGSKELFVYH